MPLMKRSEGGHWAASRQSSLQGGRTNDDQDESQRQLDDQQTDTRTGHHHEMDESLSLQLEKEERREWREIE